MIKERIKFFADTPRGEPNKYFCFATDILTLEDTIKRFLRKGFIFRAAWYEKIDTGTGEVVQNSRISATDIQRLFNEVVSEGTKPGSKTSPVTNDHNILNTDINPDKNNTQDKQ